MQLELRLLNDINTELIAWNNDELLASVNAMLDTYRDIDYNVEQIATAKADRARLNALAKALNDERIRIGKAFNAPLDRFKSEVDEVIDLTKGVTAKISAKIDAYEADRRKVKQDLVKAYFYAVVGELADVLMYGKIEDERWYNASTTEKQWKGDIDRILAKVREDLALINRLDRPDTDMVRYLYLEGNLSVATAIAKGDEARRYAVKVREDAKKVEIDTATQTVVVRFSAKGTPEQMQALKQFLVDNEIQYKPI